MPAALIDGVPKGRTALPQKIWHGGLARDYLLARHNAVTFRVEVTTHSQGLERFRQSGRRFLENLSKLTEWGPVCRPHNSLYVVNPQGKIVDRYDKRFCTSGDLRHFTPGDHFVTFEVKGVKCGLLICYDARFPELYRQYAKAGIQLVLHSFYNARQKPGSIHPKIMPITVQAHAGINYVYVSANNSSAQHSWQSRFIRPDGLVADEPPLDQPGVMVNLVDTGKSYYDASRPFRLECIDGKLHSGEVVDDLRSRDRTSY